MFRYNLFISRQFFSCKFITQTSSLDACAQNRIFDTIHDLSHPPDGGRKRTVVFITHRLSTARRADKVAMMENGVSYLYSLQRRHRGFP
jgi:ABC-type bacteriocin/lantibiotic exporter with double-glycine peptidase domain